MIKSPALAGHIEDEIHHLSVRVYYEDTDFSGVVYHASYLRFMERGRTDFLRLLGVAQGDLFDRAKDEAGAGFAFVVRSMAIEFLRPARIDDILTIETRTLEVKGATLNLAQRVLRGEEVLVEASVRVAFVAGGRPMRIPDALRRVMTPKA
ncbi:tol-pal system-associated acyl-CoA thioesterase [Phreatobacter sp. AB_2022a]|uniref:tol-pal system-associated acyl-CoA thioesterase n=1 Tax=Phreatobacter sp. AB_2022a TaxID=3003134 RepID=UPI0005713F3D|nr:tol-pal system-associated acyl-CoA thioesterase [Phreatobacter sp. AB_2022a]MCZ0735228.1 tol-pal system-associated acyl-CoA thioesterase [Phreatobacter sp. AB_2022a]CEJ14354.1 Acyl-CoA thioester hydrolase YbgC [bacterium YEK0313]